MKIHIHADKTLGAVQSDFSELFSGLKLVFFSKPHKIYKGSNAKFIIQKKEIPLKQISLDVRPGYLLLESSMTVWQVERKFEEDFGLHVQVFRKSGNIWLETSETDKLTLEAQQARSLDADTEEEIIDPMDYQEQE